YTATALAQRVQGFLPEVALNRAAGFVLRAVFSELTAGTDSLGSCIVKAVAVGVQRFGLQELAGRAAIGICSRGIVKRNFRKDLALRAALWRYLPQVRDVRPQPPGVTGQGGFRRPRLPP